MAFQLRDYQEKAVEKAVWSTQLEGNDLLVLATGAGKSVIIAEIANRLQRKILVLQPSKEILEQNVAKMRHFVPEYEIGIFSASMNQKVVRKYTFATIQSIYRKPYLFDDIGLILLDEAHGHNLKNKDGMYSQFFSAIGNPKIIGLTATPYRNVTGYHKNPETGQLFASVTLKLLNRMNIGTSKNDSKPFWKRILINVGIKDLVDRGYLCPLKYDLRTFMTHEQMKLNKSMSDFDLDDFAVKLGTKQQQLIECVREAETKFKSVLVFCPSVSQAEKFASVIPGSACVSAKTPDDERDWIISNFKAGKIKTVFNMNVLTIGFDHPALDCIILIRPTKSLLLYVQMLGRGLRIAEGKTHCTVIDWSNTVEKVGPVETVELRLQKFPEFKWPMWEVFTQSEFGEERWHNRPLYSYAIKEKGKSGHIARAMAKKSGSGKLW